jgi:hypothetical protein
MIKKISVLNVGMAAIAAALVHFLVSNFGVWASGSTDITTNLPFTRDFAGLLKCYALGLPFMKYTLVGNLIYSTIFFGSFALVKQRMRFAQ